MDYTRADFGPDFRFGVATAAYQIEGAWQEDGKGPSVWDAFSHTPGKIKTGETGDVACDFYHRYPQDLALLKSLNFDLHRFSLSWSRIFPEGKGATNPKGLAFYDRLIDETLAQGLEPWVTLYHWDLPHALERLGGWTNRDIVGWFSDYANTVTQAYGDRVKNWMVLNEPLVFTGWGYMFGHHAPGRKGFANFLPAIHHATLAQAEGGRVVRANVPNAYIGTTFSCSHVMPASQSPLDLGAAARTDALFNRLFIEPAVGLGYPWKTLPVLQLLRRYMKPGDDQAMRFDFDFLGIQNYSRMVMRFALGIPGLFAAEIPPKERAPELTEMGWEIYPEGIYHLLKKFASYGKKLWVTENGAAFPDSVQAGKVDDPKRLKFIQDYLAQVLRAKREGVEVNGYMVWTFLDNFEWAEGTHPRFGLVYVDFANQERIVKSSGEWFKQFLAESAGATS